MLSLTEWRQLPMAPSYICNREGVVKRFGKVVKHQLKSYRLCENGNYIFTTVAKVIENAFPFHWIEDLDDDEECKKVYGHPNYYITTKGRVYSLKKGQWLKPSNDYYQSLKIDDVRHGTSTLVGRTFLPDYKEGLVIMHKNENLPQPEINYLSNLEVGTHRDNIDDMIQKGRVAAVVPNEVKEAFQKFEQKFFDLVWYARSQSREQMEQQGTPEHIIQGALNSQARKEEMYVDEIDELCSERGSWQHGFNSGCLATIRYVLTALYPETFPDDESGDPNATCTYGGLKDAQDEFPMLDT